MASSSRSVIFDMAETTTTTGRFSCSCWTMRAATRMRSAEPMLVPPNFMTSKPDGSLTAVVLPSVRHARPHHFQDGLFHFFYRQNGGIQIEGVGRLREGRIGARAVALIALLHLRRQHALGDFVALGARFPQAPPHTLVGGGVEEHFDMGIGKAHGPDIAAFH